MTTEKHDPWALLREARDQLVGVQGMGKATQTIARIDAALAGRAEGSTEDVVESDPWWSIAQQRANEGRYEMVVWRRSLTEWCWDIHIFGHAAAAKGVVATESEARRAATAAAKGMK